MKTEIQNAVTFIANFLRGLNGEQIIRFRQSLSEVLVSHYRDHWFPDKPCRGSAYRCIRVNKQRMDPLLKSAGFEAGLTEAILLQYFPRELTIWVDPNEVSYRFGEDGSIGVIFEDAAPVLESTSRIQGIYDSCRKQVHELMQSSTSRGSDRPVGLDCLRSFVMV